MQLTDTKVKNAKPKKIGSIVKKNTLSDGNGLSLLITENGKKGWRLRYRFLGKYKFMSLGIYPQVSLSDARKKRDAAKKLLAQDPPIDPITYKKEQALVLTKNNELTFEVVAKKWRDDYLKRLSKDHELRTYGRLIKYVFPHIGGLPINNLKTNHIVSVVKHPDLKDKLETAKRLQLAIAQIFRYAVQHSYVDKDITVSLKGLVPAPKVQHMPAITDPKEVGALLRAIDGFNGSPSVKCALKLAPLVFTRPAELRKAKWKDIDFERKQWGYFVTKTKTDHIVPLANQAIEILKEIEPYTSHGEYVFVNGHSPKRPMSEAAINAALKRMGYDTQTEMTGHGFRAMARTLLHEQLKFDPAPIEHQLAHKVPDSLGTAYNRTKFLDERVKMMQEWADYLDKLKLNTK